MGAGRLGIKIRVAGRLLATIRNADSARAACG
jgi:hypothetical protein